MRLVLALVLAMFVCSYVCAEETSGATYNSPAEQSGECHGGFCGHLADKLNEQDCIDHTHEFNVPDREDQAGVGVDVVVYEDDNPDAKLEDITIQEKYDFQNEENSVYVVARWNVFKFFKGDK